MPPASLDQTSRARFPALDPEPPPHPWWRRLLVPISVLAVAAAVAVAVADWPAEWDHRTAGPRPTELSARGRILAQTATGGLVVGDPGGRKAAPLTGLGAFPPGLPVAADRRFVWVGDGQVLSLTGPRRLAVTQTKVKSSVSTEPTVLNLFAGHDRYAVLRNGFYGAPTARARITVDSLATGKAIALGRGHAAAGDPRTAGAFVSVATPPRPSASGNLITPDSRLELRTAGRRPVVLATAAKLNHALGARSGRQVALIPVPSPSGNQVAVEVETATASPTAEIVVLGRTGKVLDIPPAPGPPTVPTWSQDGRLAYIMLGATGRELTVWTVGGGTVTTAFPFTGARYDTCVWSPDGASVLCSDHEGSHWAVAHAAGGPMAAVDGHGVPVAWIG